MGIGNYLGPFSEAPDDGPEGQEQPIQAVGGQGELREVTQPTSMLDTCFWDHYIFVLLIFPLCMPSHHTHIYAYSSSKWMTIEQLPLNNVK